MVLVMMMVVSQNHSVIFLTPANLAIAGVSTCSNIVAVVSTSTATCAVVSANTSAAVFKSLSDAFEG